MVQSPMDAPERPFPAKPPTAKPFQLSDLKVFSARDFPSYLPKLNSLYDELFSSGKGFRSRLIQMISSPLGLRSDQVHLLAQTIEFIHNASLLHDDLVDRSALRRNKPTAWLKYSPEYAVLAGDYLLARVMVNLSRYGNLSLIQYTAEIISDLLEGEWIQDTLIDDWNVGLGQLDQVHNLKTASLFKWCLRAPFLAQENYDKALHELLDEMGSILGLLFQRSDDLLDFDVRNHEGKAILGDLKSGYLNSFGAFLAHELSSSQRAQLKGCQSLDEVQALVGPERFQQRLEDFDKINQQFIDLYLHHADSLKEMLGKGELSLLETLKKLPGPLYWRGS